MAEQGSYLCTIFTGGRIRVRLVLTALFILLAALAGTLTAAQPADGKALVEQRSKGNCLACHAINNGKLPGNLGPPLVGMKARFPDKETLRKQIWDATERNPDSRMPPFGKHQILSSEEIDLIVNYIYSL